MSEMLHVRAAAGYCVYRIHSRWFNAESGSKLSFVVETIIRLDGAYHKYYIIKTPFCWNTSNHQW